jgi:glycosyltransferase involved in cell wall biosynthesis
MPLLLVIIALLTMLTLVFTIIEFNIGFSKIKNLSDQAILPDKQLPSVSILFSALNEEKNLPAALQTLQQLNYPRLNIIAVNDRSTDNTAAILEKYHLQDPRLQIQHIQHLPAEWLGKNHALHQASLQAQGEWLLFTDADVLMHPDTITKAISYALMHGIDHLTIYEHHLRHRFWLTLLLFGSYITYCFSVKPWRARYRWSKRYVGHGAFNLVRREAYLACGGHRNIALECLDDMALAKLLKTKGYQQDIVNGRDLISREWYSSMVDMMNGLKKNSFAYFNYQYSLFFRDSIFALIFFLWPLIAVATQTHVVQWLNLINIGFLSSIVATEFRLSKWYAFLYPIAICLLLYTTCQSVISTFKNNGVIWRDTFYPLKMLKTKKWMP